jgi:hypothetical protein
MLANFVDDLGQIVVKGLAIAGGAAVAAVVIGAVVGLIVRKLFRKPLPVPARTLVRILGGVAGGLGVAVLLFTGVGNGWGLGGGQGTGTSRGDLTAATHPALAAAIEPAPKTGTPTLHSVRVIMLGGDMVRNAAAYRIDGERQARTLADLQQEIRKRMAADPPAKAVEIIVYDNSVARGAAPVADLERWAQLNNLAVTVVATPGDIPP